MLWSTHFKLKYFIVVTKYPQTIIIIYFIYHTAPDIIINVSGAIQHIEPVPYLDSIGGARSRHFAYPELFVRYIAKVINKTYSNEMKG